MNSVDVSTRAEAVPDVAPVDTKLEVAVIGGSDVDRAEAFYEKPGWRLDIDVAAGDEVRGLQVTPHTSHASLIFGTGVTPAEPGSTDSLVPAVGDTDAARDELYVHEVDTGGHVAVWQEPELFAAELRAPAGHFGRHTDHQVSP